MNKTKKILTITIMLIVSISGLSGLIDAENSQDYVDYADIPTWYYGDIWRYQGEAYGAGENWSFDGSAENIVQEVVDKVTITHGNDNIESYKIELTGSITGDFETEELDGAIEADIEGISYFRVSDLAQIKTEISLTGTVTPEFPPIPLDFEINSENEFFPPFENYDFVIIPGWEWEISSHVYSNSSFYLEEFYDNTSSGDYWTNETLECIKKTGVTTPAGYFSSYQIAGVDSESEDGTYYSPKAGNVVKGGVDYSDEETTFFLETELKSYSRKDQPIQISVEILPTQFPVPDDQIEIRGNIKDDDENPVQNNQVTIDLPALDESWTTTTDDNGDYSKTITAPQLSDDTPCSEDYGSQGLIIRSTSGSDSGYKTITLESVENKAPFMLRKIQGPLYGYIGIEYDYSVSGYDLNGDQIYYLIDWGDESETDWIGPYPPGESQIVKKIWNDIGTFEIKVQPKDDREAIGEWTNPKEIEIEEPLTVNLEGPIYSKIEHELFFNVTPNGGFKPYIFWEWDFGDGTNTTEQNTSHIYNQVGDYILTLTVIDNKETEWVFEIEVYIKISTPPEKPTIDGPETAKVRRDHTYTAVTTDVEENQIYYYFDWGDETNSGWLGPYESGEQCNASNKWWRKGNYDIRVKAKDEHDVEGPWSDPFTVSMPKSKNFDNVIINRIIEFLKNFFLFLIQ